MAVDPTGADLKAFLAAPDDGPIVMLNLLRFKPDGGRALYDQYGAAVIGTFLPQVGGEIVYAGDGHPALVAESGQAWDAVILVRYPSRAAFLTMVSDPEYQKVTHLRTEALEEAVLQPTTSWL